MGDISSAVVWKLSIGNLLKNKSLVNVELSVVPETNISKGFFS